MMGNQGVTGRVGSAETGSRESGLASRPGPAGFNPARMAERMSDMERKAIMHREGASEPCMSWDTAYRLYDLGLTVRRARFLRLTALGHEVRTAAIAMEAAKPLRRETGSTRKGDSAGPKDIAQRGSHD